MANNDSTKRVPLELLCMLILKEGDRYGYEMVQEIESRSGGLLSFNLPRCTSHCGGWRSAGVYLPAPK